MEPPVEVVVQEEEVDILVEEAGRTVRHLSGAAFDPMGDVDAPFFAAAPGVVGQLVSAIHALGYPLGT